MHGPLTIALALAAGLSSAPAPVARPAPPAKARPAPVRPLRLLILPAPAGAPKTVDVRELRRLLGLLLKRSAVRVEIGPAQQSGSFPQQVWRARTLGNKRNAMAVVWFGSFARPADSREAELFLHLVDRVTHKALIKTLRLRGRVGFDLHQQVALKLWTLLRASLLELQGTRRARDPALARLLPSPPPPSRPQIRVQRVLVKPTGRPTRVRLGLGYVGGVFASGQAWHHGVWLNADVVLGRFPRSGLSLALGASVELLWPVELDSEGIALRLDLIPAYLGLALGWQRGAFRLEGRLRGGALVQKAGATVPGVGSETFWRGNPLVGVSLGVGWSPVRRLTLELRATADGLLRGQCFETAVDAEICVDRARFTLGAGLRLALP